MSWQIAVLRKSPLLVTFALLLPLITLAQSMPNDVAYEFHSIVPLGIESFKLEPASQTLNLLASAESPLFEGVKLLGHGRNRIVMGPDGRKISRYPQEITFRVTASATGKALDDKPSPVETSDDVNKYLLGLRFKLKVFRGLEYREFAPQQTEQVGVPNDVPYSERIYRLIFALDNVSVDERILLEVYDSSGERLTRFHLELM
jgi:hypothetical protein